MNRCKYGGRECQPHALQPVETEMGRCYSFNNDPNERLVSNVSGTALFASLFNSLIPISINLIANDIFVSHLCALCDLRVEKIAFRTDDVDALSKSFDSKQMST